MAGKYAIVRSTEIPEDSESVTADVSFVNSFQGLSLVQILQISNINNKYWNT